MKTGIVTFGLLILPLAASAALPPQYQRQRELTQIIESPEVEDALGGRPIDSVTTNGDDIYVVTAGACSVVVEIVENTAQQPSGWAGPRQFGLSVGVPACSDENDS
jgi:hypothetical protein